MHRLQSRRRQCAVVVGRGVRVLRDAPVVQLDLQDGLRPALRYQGREQPLDAQRGFGALALAAPPGPNADEPPLDPPGVISKFQGFLVMPFSFEWQKEVRENSGLVVRP